MESEFFILLVVICIGFIVLGFLIRSWILGAKQKPDQLISDLLRSFDSRSHEQSVEIRQQTKSLNDRLDNAARIIAAVQKNIGEFSEIGRSMRDLQTFFKNPKLRGNIGEEVLADLISQMFPKSSFHLQHQFKNGSRVDAAIKTDAGILSIDAKFPLENWQRMVGDETENGRDVAKKEFIKNIKGHIEVISEKYILPDEGTLDFALMYVPSEQVYYELVCSSEVMTFAKRHRVYPVSPTTLYAHLQTILLSFAGRQIEVKAKQVFKLLRAMNQDYEKIVSNLGVMGRHVTNAYNQMNNVNEVVTHLGQKLNLSQNIRSDSKEDTLQPELP